MPLLTQLRWSLDIPIIKGGVQLVFYFIIGYAIDGCKKLR